MQRQVCPPNENHLTPIQDLNSVACQLITPLLGDDVAAFKEVYFKYPHSLTYHFNGLPGIEAGLNYLIFAASARDAFYCLEFMIDMLIATENSEILFNIVTHDKSTLLLMLLQSYEVKSISGLTGKVRGLSIPGSFYSSLFAVTDKEKSHLDILIKRLLLTPNINLNQKNNENKIAENYIHYLPMDIQNTFKCLKLLDYLKIARLDRTSFFSLLPRDIQQYVLMPYINNDPTICNITNINNITTTESNLRLPKKDDLYRHLWR